MDVDAQKEGHEERDKRDRELGVDVVHAYAMAAAGSFELVSDALGQHAVQ
jgi:hypothetical protein